MLCFINANIFYLIIIIKRFQISITILLLKLYRGTNKNKWKIYTIGIGTIYFVVVIILMFLYYCVALCEYASFIYNKCGNCVFLTNKQRLAKYI